jgi:hypothetical protein
MSLFLTVRTPLFKDKKFTRSNSISLQVGIQPHSVADPDPHNFGKLDPDLHQSGKLNPNPHGSLRGSFLSIGGSKSGKK